MIDGRDAGPHDAVRHFHERGRDVLELGHELRTYTRYVTLRLPGRRVLVVGAGTRPSEDPDAPVGNGRAISVWRPAGAAVACADVDRGAAEETARRGRSRGREELRRRRRRARRRRVRGDRRRGAGCARRSRRVGVQRGNSANITISPGPISISTPAKWLGAKTCAGKPPGAQFNACGRSSSAIHRHVVGLDIGSVICKRRSYIKPRDRRSARGRHDQRRPEQAARVWGLFRVSLDFPLNPSEAFAIGRVETLVDHYGPHDIWRGSAPAPAECVEHVLLQFSMLEPDRLAGFLRRDRLGSNSGANRRSAASR